MKALQNYLKRNGYNYTIGTYGSNYFYNAPPVIYEGIQLIFPWDADRRQEEKIKKYAIKHGYIVFFEWHNLQAHGFTIATSTDRKAIELYSIYETKARQEIENIIHLTHVNNGDFAKANKLAERVMNKYGMMYNAERVKQATA